MHTVLGKQKIAIATLNNASIQQGIGIGTNYFLFAPPLVGR